MNEPAVQRHEKEKSRWITAIKIACTATTATFFGLGIRAAFRQARPVEPTDLTRFKVMSGVGFASKALGIATLLTVSGYGLFVMGIVTFMDVNTPSQFGTKMKDVFGDRLRISKGNSIQTYESLSELFEAVGKKENDK
uniref:Transmembrane protein 242 n=1 Tax=Panagrolaimus superbus TaxID=310955 RepID=A0A914Z6A1_9BILA